VKFVTISVCLLLAGPALGAVHAPAVHGGDENNPTWSPDGKRLLFSSTVQHNAHLYVVRADGTGQRNLGSVDDPFPAASWSPDGKRIMSYATRESARASTS
jgi:TolB protein